MKWKLLIKFAVMDEERRENEGGDGVRRELVEGNSDSTADESDERIDEKIDGDGTRRRGSDNSIVKGSQFSQRKAQESAQRVVVRNENPFFFWLWFMGIMSTIMLVFVVGTSILNSNVKIEILSMPTGVREHFEAGKQVKVEVGRDRSPVKMFVRASVDPHAGAETVLLLHGLGSSSFLYRQLLPLLAAKQLAAVAVDLPGAGLSEKSYVASEATDNLSEDDHRKGFLQIRLEALKELLVEGFFPKSSDESSEHEFLRKLKGSTNLKGKKLLALGSDELGHALDQIVASLEVAPVHLVMHDTGVEVGLAWASQNPSKVASLTLVDSVPRLPSLPFWLFTIPLVGPVIAHSDLAFRWVLRSCCLHYVTAETAKDYIYLLRSSNGLRALMKSWTASNSSMDVAEWAGNSNLEDVPKQILWASGWSKEWQKEGEQLAKNLPGAAFRSHHGSRWPQEDAAPEIAEMIAELVKSLPPSAAQPEMGELLEDVARKNGNPAPHQSYSSQGGLGHNHGHLQHSHDHDLGYTESLGGSYGASHGGWVL